MMLLSNKKSSKPCRLKGLSKNKDVGVCLSDWSFPLVIRLSTPPKTDLDISDTILTGAYKTIIPLPSLYIAYRR